MTIYFSFQNTLESKINEKIKNSFIKLIHGSFLKNKFYNIAKESNKQGGLILWALFLKL